MKRVLLFAAMMTLFITDVFAQRNDMRTIRDALNDNGTIKTGISGNFSGQGYKMKYDHNGAPLFFSADSGYWDPIGTSSFGLNDGVQTIVVSGSDVYVGGYFTNAGGNPDADHIARWNGSGWEALGTGLSDEVKTIAISGTDIYAGGVFTNAGGNPDADRIAKWNGVNWEALGTGLNYPVHAIAISGTDVYVGGYFTDAGGIDSADNIAKWNGSAWEALGPGLNTNVDAIAISGSNIYVGGSFENAGGNPNLDKPEPKKLEKIIKIWYNIQTG